MLTRIVIINSELYAKADIELNDAVSIQLEADSNVGKSSLINTLNFLYIIDQKQMLFEGDRKLKESIKHYFKFVNQSFVVFEINKGGYTYSILVKANANFELEYYKFDCSYNEAYFFEKSEKGFSPLTFEKIIANLLINTNSKPSLLRPDELYDLVYSRKIENKPVVWVTDKITRTGKSLSNSFSKIYHYLLKSSDINEKEFKKALLIAANLNDEALPVFANNTNKKIDELKKTELEVKNLKAISEEFKLLKKANDDHTALYRLCSELKNTFTQHFNKETKDIAESISETGELKIGIRSLDVKIKETLTRERIKFRQDETKYQTLIEAEQNKLNEISKELSVLANYEKGSLQYSGLLNQLEEAREKYVSISSELKKINREKVTEAQLLSEIKKANALIETLKNKERQFDNILGQNISDNIEIRKKLNSILSEQLLSRPINSLLKRKVCQTEDILRVFDGELDLTELTVNDMETIEDVQVEISRIAKEIEQKNVTLEVVVNIKKKGNQLTKLDEMIRERQQLLDRIEKKDQLLEQKKRITEVIKEYQLKELEARDNSYKKELEIRKAETLMEIEKNRVRQYESRENTLKINHGRIKDFKLANTVNILDKNIDEAFEDLLIQYGNLNSKENERFKLFVAVNKDLKIDEESIDRFIQKVQIKIDNISDLDSIYKDLLQLVYTEFTKPTSDFLDKYKHFQRFISDYNKELADFPVSNITKLSIVAADNQKELQTLSKIASLDNKAGLFFTSVDQTESIKALEDKIREGKVVCFDQLFDLRISLEIDGVKKPNIDLSKQVESRATDRVLKLFLFLSIIRRLVRNSPDNKIVLYIDELGEIGPHNVRQIINYCTKYNFLPIFAAPRQIEGIEKYYVIKKTNSKQALKVDNGNVKSIRYKNAKPIVL